MGHPAQGRWWLPLSIDLVAFIKADSNGVQKLMSEEVEAFLMTTTLAALSGDTAEVTERLRSISNSAFWWSTLIISSNLKGESIVGAHCAERFFESWSISKRPYYDDPTHGG